MQHFQKTVDIHAGSATILTIETPNGFDLCEVTSWNYADLTGMRLDDGPHIDPRRGIGFVTPIKFRRRAELRFVNLSDTFTKAIVYFTAYNTDEITALAAPFQCKHDKVYSTQVLLSDPPQYPWICRLCGEKGTDQTWHRRETYAEVEHRFALGREDARR